MSETRGETGEACRKTGRAPQTRPLRSVERAGLVDGGDQKTTHVNHSRLIGSKWMRES